MKNLVLFLFVLFIASCTPNSIIEVEYSDQNIDLSESSSRHCSDGYMNPTFVDENGCCHFQIPYKVLESHVDEYGNPPRVYYIVCADDKPVHLTKVGINAEGDQIEFCDLILDCSCNTKSGDVTSTIIPFGKDGDCCIYKVTVVNSYNKEIVIKNIYGDIEIVIPANSTSVILQDVCLPQFSKIFNIYLEDCEGNEKLIDTIKIEHDC